MQMKVLHITTHLGGGAGKAIAGIIISGKMQIESSVVLLDAPSNMTYVDLLKNAGVSIYELPSIDQMLELIAVSDIVVFNWWGHPLMVKLFMQLPEVLCRAIIWSHVNGCTYPYLPGDFLREFDFSIFTTKYSYANQMWSDLDREYIVSNSTVVYGMGDFYPEKVQAKKDYSGKDNFVVGYAGTLNYAKINPFFLDYYEEIIKHIPNVRFLMLGTPSDDIIEDIMKRDLSGYFEFPGYVSNVYEYLKKMDVFAYLLNEKSYATTENALIEAMATGLPIIVLDSDVEKNIIFDGINGFLVHDVEEFGTKVKELKDEHIASRVGESARKYCIETYSAEKNYYEFEEKCMKILKTAKTSHLFKECFGKSPFEAFCFVAGNDATLLKSKANEVISDEKFIRCIPPIYKEKEKASINQYSRIFIDDFELKKLRSIIDKYENT